MRVRWATGLTARTTCHSKQPRKFLNNPHTSVRIIKDASENILMGEEADLKTLVWGEGWGTAEGRGLDIYFKKIPQVVLPSFAFKG